MRDVLGRKRREKKSSGNKGFVAIIHVPYLNFTYVTGRTNPATYYINFLRDPAGKGDLQRPI